MEREPAERLQVLGTLAVTASDADADPAASGRVGTKVAIITNRGSAHTGLRILTRVRLRFILCTADSVYVIAPTTIRPECQPLPKADPIRNFADVLMITDRQGADDLKQPAH
jgi:hypothetical protein